MRRLAGPATLYPRPLPVTLQFATTTWNSLRVNAPVCKSAAYAHPIWRTLWGGAAPPPRPPSEKKFRAPPHLGGAFPSAGVRGGAPHRPLPPPDVYESTQKRSPFPPAVLAAIDAPPV